MASIPDSSPAFNWDYPSPFVSDLLVSAEHIDGLGHVNNSVYVGWCQQAGWRHSQALGLDLESYRTLGAAMAIRHAEYDYSNAAYAGDQCKLATWLTACDGRLTMERRFQLVHTDGRTLLRATWQLVCISMISGKARRFPREFLDIYGAAVVSAAAD